MPVQHVQQVVERSQRTLDLHFSVWLKTYATSRKTCRMRKLAKPPESENIVYDAEVEIAKRIQRHFREMPMKMSPVSVFYCLRADIRAILKRAGASPASAGTANADEKSQPQEQAFKDEDGYARFNRWKKVQSKRTKDQDFELFMKLYRTQRCSLRTFLQRSVPTCSRLAAACFCRFETLQVKGCRYKRTYDIIRRRRAKRKPCAPERGIQGRGRRI